MEEKIEWHKEKPNAHSQLTQTEKWEKQNSPDRIYILIILNFNSSLPF